MTPSRMPGDEHGTAADLDAFRRHRAAAPNRPVHPLTMALDELIPSDDPGVVFARLGQVCVPAFCDGWSVDSMPRVSHRSPGSGEDECDTGAGSEPHRTRHALHLPFAVGADGITDAFAGVLTMWWRDRQPSPAEIAQADLLVRHGVAVVDRQRLLARAARAESAAAHTATAAIASRRVSMAVGIVMHERGCDADEAESLLVDMAAEYGSDLFELSTDVVRRRGLGGPARAERRGGPPAALSVVIDHTLREATEDRLGGLDIDNEGGP